MKLHLSFLALILLQVQISQSDIFEDKSGVFGESITTYIVYFETLINWVKTTWLYCKFGECCDENSIFFNNVEQLKVTIKNKLYGQHFGQLIPEFLDNVLNQNRKKPLVLSFHGWTGVGKTFVSSLITDALYKNGMQSSYVHYFHSLHFSRYEKLELYKEQLNTWIKGNMSECDKSLFIFEDMHRMFPELIASIRPLLDYGYETTKSIFIFVSNAGAEEISQEVFLRIKNSQSRETIDYEKLEKIIISAAYNDKSGSLGHSSLIDSHVIDLFVPFLPLEKRHVKLCIRDALRKKENRLSKFNLAHISECDNILDEIAEKFTYRFENLFSSTGCKTFENKVNHYIARLEGKKKIYSSYSKSCYLD